MRLKGISAVIVATLWSLPSGPGAVVLANDGQDTWSHVAVLRGDIPPTGFQLAVGPRSHVTRQEDGGGVSSFVASDSFGVALRPVDEGRELARTTFLRVAPDLSTFIEMWDDIDGGPSLGGPDAPVCHVGQAEPSLTDETAAPEDRAWDWFVSCYAEWLAAFSATGGDARELERVEMLASYVPSMPGLAEAVRAADLIVVGTVTDTIFRPTWSSTVTLDVEETLKGDPKTSVEVEMAGGPQPGPDWSEGILAVAANAPLLLDGDRAILFLEGDPDRDGVLGVQSFSGWYLISPDGDVSPTDGNAFTEDLPASAEDFMAVIRRLGAAS